MSESLLMAAYRMQQAGNLAEAARLYGDILRAEPENFDARYLLGFVHFQREQFADAERLMGEALKLNPRSLDALRNRGIALMKLERCEEALASFDRALAINPEIFELLLARAQALMALKRYRDALLSLDAAVSLRPDAAEAWNNRGNAQRKLKRHREALASFDQAAALKPEIAQIWTNRANVLAELGHFDEAIASYDKSLALEPRNAATLNLRAVALYEAKRYSEAARDFSAVMKLDPAYAFALGYLLDSKLRGCDWIDFETERDALNAELSAGARVLTPVQGSNLLGSCQAQLRCARIWAADIGRAATPPLWNGERYRHERIRLAYLSADFHSHATAYLMAGVFECHDRKSFEVSAVSFGPDDNSEMRARLRGAFETFIDIGDRNDGEAAALLRRMEIDIAVDLKGYTQDSRPGILGHRPAPVQAQYLGFPGTMGTEFIDYILADRVVIPDEQRIQYSEKVVYLPDSYQCNDSKRAILDVTPGRAEARLPEKGFVFCSFNNSYKITPEMFDVWLRLLHAIEGSVLWLLDDNRAAVDNLKREAELRGLSSSRLIFAPRIAMQEHLARLRLADLFLDTLPCNAHTTASDALWAGLPVLTCLGATFAGRVAASLLHAVGLPELVTHSLAEFEALGLKLARDPASLGALKAKLANNRDTHPLFDTSRFTKHLEAAYRTMWERAACGEKPAAFAVEPLP